jgi:transglutaminase-like putative cysteine protease
MSAPTFSKHLCAVAIAIIAADAVAGPQGDGPQGDGNHAPVDLYKPLSLEVTKGDRYDVELTGIAALPAGSILYFPVPPTTESQSDVEATMVTTSRGKETPAQLKTDSSQQRRPIFTVLAKGKEDLEVRARFSFQMWRRALVNKTDKRGPGVKPLTGKEVALYTAPTPSHHWTDPSFQTWLLQNRLTLKSGETPVRFAHRALLFVAKHFTYTGEIAQGRTHGEIARMGKGECNTISAVYTSILRANRIPCRRICGRLLPGGQTHNKVEFFAKDIGWIPVEPTGAIQSNRKDRMDCFGVDKGDFFVCMRDSDLLLPTGGQQYRCGALCQFVVIQDQLTGHTIKDAWRVNGATR